MQKKRFTVLSGAGISAESGLKTFRDGDGLWEGHKIEEVATPEAWQADKEKVLRFYNERRRAVKEAKPNEAHKLLARLEDLFDVQIITQNIDDLHERAGSRNVLHLHGEIFKSRSTKNPELVYDIKGTELVLGDKCQLGSQLRPHIVWFGEAVTLMDEAIRIAEESDYFLVIGTSLVVYPAAGLRLCVPKNCKKFLVDPKVPVFEDSDEYEIYNDSASKGMKKLFDSIYSKQIN